MRFPCVNLKIGHPFFHGIELVNDPSTPMLFVIETLQEIAELPHRDAAVAVAICHSNGGVLIQMVSAESAATVAHRVRERARQASWPLECHAVDATTPSLLSHKDKVGDA
jgi:ATP-dependent Clp protease adapter protein ClpS